MDVGQDAGDPSRLSGDTGARCPVWTVRIKGAGLKVRIRKSCEVGDWVRVRDPETGKLRIGEVMEIKIEPLEALIKCGRNIVTIPLAEVQRVGRLAKE